MVGQARDSRQVTGRESCAEGQDPGSARELRKQSRLRRNAQKLRSGGGAPPSLLPEIPFLKGANFQRVFTLVTALKSRTLHTGLAPCLTSAVSSW